ncbi:MAG: phage tail assembly protein [Hyphomicrobiaceae bacterium]
MVATISLSRPIPGHNGDITVIELRRPVFLDWMECEGDIHETTVIDPAAMARGEPGAARVNVRPDRVGAWIQRLSGLPMATLARLDLADARKVFREVSALVGNLDAGN